MRPAGRQGDKRQAAYVTAIITSTTVASIMQTPLTSRSIEGPWGGVPERRVCNLNVRNYRPYWRRVGWHCHALHLHKLWDVRGCVYSWRELVIFAGIHHSFSPLSSPRETQLTPTYYPLSVSGGGIKAKTLKCCVDDNGGRPQNHLRWASEDKHNQLSDTLHIEKVEAKVMGHICRL